jgi:molybdopterin-guanine dinucleotide biosynthesis protein A
MTAGEPGPSRRRVAIVLAGGSARRFGRDKLSEPVRGRPLLDHAILAVAEIAGEILVVGDAGPAELPRLDPRLAGTTLRRIPDAQPGAGPLPALATALDEAGHGTAFVVGGDMPDLVPAVLELLADTMEREPVGAAQLSFEGGPRPLPAALDIEPAAEAARDALAAGESSLRALLARLRVEVIPEEAWRARDPDARTVRDVDRVQDLVETERRPHSRRASCGR